MQDKKPRLAFLMETMGITGAELARALHIDDSLVSKWKSGKRRLSQKNNYLKKISNYILLVDERTGYRFVKQLLREYDPGNDLESIDNLSNCLCRWLSEQKPYEFTLGALFYRNNLRDAYHAGFKVYRGNTGRRAAVLEFFDAVLSMPEGQQLLLVSQEDMSWMLEDLTFLNTWKHKLTEVIKRNNKIKIIHWVDRNIENLTAIINYWLPLHLEGKIASFYYSLYWDSPFKTTYFVVENSFAITGMSQGDDYKNRYTAFYHDPATIAHFEWVFKTILTKCRPLIEVYPIEETNGLVNRVMDVKLEKENSYLVTDTPLFMTMSRDLIMEVLTETPAEPAQIERCLDHHRDFNRVTSTTLLNRHIYSTKKLEQAMESGRISYKLLSGILGFKVTASKNHFIKHILLLIERLEDDNFEIALTPGNFPTETVPVNLFLKQYSFVMAWSKEQLRFVILADEPTVVTAFNNFYEQVWHSIPRINRDKARVKDYLHKLIKRG
jgi:transcriptional regulator with XRE-family HTH domain